MPAATKYPGGLFVPEIRVPAVRDVLHRGDAGSLYLSERQWTAVMIFA